MTKGQLEYWELLFKVIAYFGGAILFIIKIRNDAREYKLKEIEINVKNESLKATRFNYLEKLSNDFNKASNKPALYILDDFEVDGIYITDLMTTLRDHNKIEISEENELKLRDSFDSLLESCLLLHYHYEQGMITMKEVNFFSYYLKKMNNCEGVLNYIQLYYKDRGLDKLLSSI